MKHTALLFLLFFFSSNTLAASRTDLGPTGNLDVAKKFEVYKKGPAICAAANPNLKRVIISGFGPFSGSPSNISGEILKHFGGFQTPSPDVNAHGTTREVEINSHVYQICFVVAATTWDLASAILVTEAEKFTPHFILMTGLGSSNLVLETSGINVASPISGYDMDGTSLAVNLPQENYVLPAQNLGVQPKIQMSWDALAVQSAVNSSTKALGFSSVVETQAFPDDYICNNIRFVVAHAALNVPLELAGGLINWQPHFSNTPVTGFAHYPLGISTDKDSLDGWSDVLSQIISATL